MKKLITALLFIASSLANAGQGAEQVNSYFASWLKNHHFEQFDKRSEGIFFTKNGALLDGDIYEVKDLKGGTFYSVESRISLTFKNGRRLDDFVAGAGNKAEDAFYDSLQNFCLTTLHPIYAELFDHNDPHVRKTVWNVNGAKRRVFLSEWGLRGKKIDEKEQKRIEQLLEKEFKTLKVSDEIHWIKLVAGGNEGQVKTLAFTVDGI
ncbi:MAG: hypothetical protein HYZ54_12015, partial [Ignavibacteriae bacterium]|nr:hypothetical protein [Ignavibacteriota bacterium]